MLGAHFGAGSTKGVLMRQVRRASSAISIALAVSITGCDKPRYPTVERPSLHTTISSDGQMVAALDRIGTDQPRLRVIRLDNGSDWKVLLAPPHTTSIRFGLQGYELLLTRHVGDHDIADLLKWDLADPDKPIERIHRSYGLAFPLEVSPNQYIVRACSPSEPLHGTCPKKNGKKWILVNAEGVIETFIRPSGIVNQSQPNVVTGKGFFWRDPLANQISDSLPKKDATPFLKIPYPEGDGPDTKHLEPTDASTRNFICDYQAKRCLRLFVSNWKNKEPGPYVYNIDVFYRNIQCRTDGLEGYIERASITPDGHTAVLAMASRYEAPRRIVVMRFVNDECGPVSVKTILPEE